MKLMRVILLLLMAISFLGSSTSAFAQATEEPLPGKTASSILPAAKVFGDGWSQSDVVSPDAIVRYDFKMSPDVFREGAVGIYAGPNGSRAVIVNLLLTANRVAIRKSWEDASALMVAINRPVATDYERDNALELMPAPKGCLEAKRAEGVENVFRFTSGSTLCAASDDSVLLVTVYGPVNGQTGVTASDAVTLAIVGK
ncbi:MAG: hypothetical protein ACR2OU_17415 [Thermomicrobiales bacterium]